MPATEERPFRVLTLDGGGMRGLYSASLLRTLARLFDERFIAQEPDLGKSFDLICGTSTGAILASALAAGISLRRVSDLYCEHGHLIFPRPMPKKTRKVTLTWWICRHRHESAASAEKLRSCLEQTLGSQTLGDVFRARGIALCVTAVDALSHKAWVFKTPHIPERHRDNNYRLVDVCMASTAAPIFFPLYRQRNPDESHSTHHFVDGGLWANNPVMVGLVEALILARRDREIQVISVGTCDQPSGDPYAVQSPNWGILDWRVGVTAIDMSLSAQSFGYDHMARLLATELSRSGRNVTVIRLEEGRKSPEQYSAIGLDRADQAALETLVYLAQKDAEQIHGKTIAGPKSPVAEVFQNLATLSPDR